MQIETMQYNTFREQNNCFNLYLSVQREHITFLPNREHRMSLRAMPWLPLRHM